MEDSVEKHGEIIIIRRGGGDDGAAVKGGAWKIAYADFVTAMMAFFLVMWLINSANDVTKARVASYFNPIKMTDASPSGRGLNTETSSKNKAKKSEKAGSGAAGGKETESHTAEEEKPEREEAMLANPFKALDELSSDGSGSPTGRTVDIVTQKSGDPFDPMVWEALRKGVQDSKVSDGSKPIDKKKGVGEAAEPHDANKAGDGTASSTSTPPMEEVKDSPAAEKPKKAVQNKEAKLLEQAERGEAEAKDIKEKLQDLLSTSSELASLNLDVKLTSEGLLIVLGDGDAFSMFRVGSAEPNPTLIAFIGKIGQLLSDRDGKLIVRGHTDARPFQVKAFDNWQLSTARAHMTSYMIIRGGFPESRIERIEGYGSTRLLNKEDPLADVNRRVEFVLVPPA